MAYIYSSEQRIPDHPILQERRSRWTDAPAIIPNWNSGLAEEIRNLRRMLESTVSAQESLTADCVLNLSHMLDEKIYQYMKNDNKHIQSVG